MTTVRRFGYYQISSSERW